jgi:hypothetical protein
VDEVTGREGESGRLALGSPSSSVIESVLFRVRSALATCCSSEIAVVALALDKDNGEFTLL